ncbi:MAG: histidinol dehydrogenase [Melioribacteraceae bacterium]|nr:histidinol dehydrogenase [Melioribacteraceae bacterium]
MKVIEINNLSEDELLALTKRPAINMDSSFKVVRPIIDDVKIYGKYKLIEYARKYDNYSADSLRVSPEEISEAEESLPESVKKAIDVSADNIRKFHKCEKPQDIVVDIRPGIKCSRRFVAIENVGLYIPGGSAVLPSTMLMLGIPASIAGCRRIIACTPVSEIINPAVLYAAKLAGVKEIYKVGGAQAIAMMAYGVENVKKVDKIFGPGNQYVTAAKALVSTDPDGCLIDMPAGPSEVLVIADDGADPKYIAADLLSQAEHGADSQVVLCCTSRNAADRILTELEIQLDMLPRKELAAKALDSSFCLLVGSYDQAITFSNSYAPEHLIMNFNDSAGYVEKVVNAGSVFIGPYSPESAGDYSSGTNHSLPTYGYSKATGGVTVEMFMKSITFQELTNEGLRSIAETIITMAETEKLNAHANSVKVRFE